MMTSPGCSDDGFLVEGGVLEQAEHHAARLETAHAVTPRRASARCARRCVNVNEPSVAQHRRRTSSGNVLSIARRNSP